MPDTDREQAAQGATILHRLVPAPDHGAGWKRDPETGFVYYSSEWLGDLPDTRNPNGYYSTPRKCFYCDTRFEGRNEFWEHVLDCHLNVPKAPE